jgi:hypothetical protein
MNRDLRLASRRMSKFSARTIALRTVRPRHLGGLTRTGIGKV